jgi:1,4-alpha-glucan branching enzyme
VGVSPAWRERVLGDAVQARRRRIAQRMKPAAIAAGILLLAGGVMMTRATRDRALESAARRGRDTVRFSVVAPAARRVSLVGDFNVWDPKGVAMHRGTDGHTWTVEVSLPPGRHAFAYMVDGTLRADPAAAKAVEDDFGSPSSVVVVAARGLE